MTGVVDDPAAREVLHRLVRERRTVHDFLPQPIDESIVREALSVMRWAPNHHRTEPWRVYLLGPAAQEKVARLNAAMVGEARGERAAEIKLRRWLAMPGWLVMTSRTSDDALREREDYAACCCAAQNMMLSLWAAGVGAKWTTGAVVRAREFADIVGFDPGDEAVVGLFWYGYPANLSEQRRQPVDAFVTAVE